MVIRSEIRYFVADEEANILACVFFWEDDIRPGILFWYADLCLHVEER